jgi:hypothetical protein
MGQILTIPHRSAHGLCPVNGIRDVVQWRTGRNWSNEFVHGLGQGGGFAYLRFNFADPPRQVFWGIASPRQHRYLADLFTASYSEYENTSFKYSWSQAVQALDRGAPSIIGPLDMFHLHFYPEIYHQRHIPIHYLLLIGYDDTNAYVHDTGLDEVQVLPISELVHAWDVNTPGLGKRNRLVILDLPTEITPDGSLIRRSIGDQCTTALNPPVSMLGIPALQKLSREITNWPVELGEQSCKKCLNQVREYLNSPPDLMGGHLTAGRDLYITFLEQAATMAGMDFSEAVNRFRIVTSIIPDVAAAIQEVDLATASAGFADIAKLEKEAFSILANCVA